MSGGDVVLLVVAAVLVVLAGLLVAVETALTRTSRVRAEEARARGRTGAKALAAIAAEPARFLNVILLVRVAAEVTATVLVGRVCLEAIDVGWQAVVVAALVMVVVSYVVIGVSPRTLGRQHSDAIALRAAPGVRALTRVLGPLPRLLILIGNAVTPGKGYRQGPFASEAELRELVDIANADKVIDETERDMIHSVFELGDTIVREVMVPRPDVVSIEGAKTLRQALSLALRSGFSRIPVVGENVDDVIGIVYLRDLAQRTHEYHESESTERVTSVMRAATFVPESKPVDALLREMQLARIHVAVVVDEYGGTAGIVTIEDILEEIVGEITDEYDTEPVAVEHLVGGSVRVSSRLHLEDLADELEIELSDDDVDSVGGLLAKALGQVPIPGSVAVVHGLRLEAEGPLGRRHRVGTVLVTPLGRYGEDDDA